VITSARSSEQPQVDNSNFEEISDEFEEEAPLQAFPRKYINDMVKDVEDVFDHKYGVRYDASSQSFKVGNSKLSILNNDLIIQNKTYKGAK
jgi:conjugal transfer/entry exclusion protein